MECTNYYFVVYSVHLLLLSPLVSIHLPLSKHRVSEEDVLEMEVVNRFSCKSQLYPM